MRSILHDLPAWSTVMTQASYFRIFWGILGKWSNLPGLWKVKFGIGVDATAPWSAVATVAEDSAVALVRTEGLKDEGPIPTVKEAKRSWRSVKNLLVFVSDQLVKGRGPLPCLGVKSDGGGVKPA